MKKSIWIFLLAILAPGVVLGWLALRSAEEQQIIFERRTAELYQKETENLAEEVRTIVESERRGFGDVVHRLLANGDAEALARDFTNTLSDAWPRKAVGFALSGDGRMLSPTASVAAGNAAWREFLWNNSSFLCSTKPAVVYPVQVANPIASSRYRGTLQQKYAESDGDGKPALQLAASEQSAVLAQRTGRQKNEPVVDPVRQESGRAIPGDIQGAVPERAASPGQNEASDGSAFANPLPAPAAPPASRMSDPGAGGLGGLRADTPAPDATGPPGLFGNQKQGLAEDEKRTAAKLEKVKKFDASGDSLVAPKPQKPAAAISGKTVSAVGDGKDRKGREEFPRPANEIAEANPEESVEGKKFLEEAQPAQGLAKGKSESRSKEGIQAGEGIVVRKSGESGWLADKAQSLQRGGELLNRLVEPQQQIRMRDVNWSSIVPSTADFSTLTAASDEGMVSRFVQDKLELIFWIRPPEAPDMIFGCLVDSENLRELWSKMLGQRRADRVEGDKPPFVLALLDDKARPVATRSSEGAGRDWKRPFVASEIGEMLPHWEAALYLATPTAIIDTARGFRRTLSFTIAGALALIAIGGWLVVADVRRQLALAQQKTDFVSNVSHELKTPLTSIRMFAELLHDRPPPREKQGQYLRIITVEAERLTRLINNVLDFAKLERKQRRFEKKALDLHEIISRVWEGHEIHLRDAGFVTKWEAAPGPYPVIGDEDALAQVLVNLLSNAEKYSRETKDVELVTWLEAGWVNVSVLDRGLGVPEGEEKKIFEAFFRAHDSLSSGIQGSGLGLTLASRLAVEHGGAVRFERRQGGGSRFTLRVPLAAKSERNEDV